MKPSRRTKVFLISLLAVLAAAGGFIHRRIGLRNFIGMLRYDQRREGSLKVGQTAPDVVLAGLDGSRRASLREYIGGRPLVVIFGSYT